MKKRALVLSAAFAAIALASCNEKTEEVGLTTVMPEQEASSSQIAELVKDCNTINNPTAYKSISHITNKSDLSYTSIGNYFLKAYDSANKTTVVVSKNAHKTVCDITPVEDKTAKTETTFYAYDYNNGGYVYALKVEKDVRNTETLETEITYSFYSIYGDELFGDVTGSNFDVEATRTYSDSDGLNHTLTILSTSDNMKTVYKYIDTTVKGTTYLDSDPRTAVLGYTLDASNFGIDGYYRNVSCASGVKYTFVDKTGTKINDIILPSNTYHWFANDGVIYYQTRTIVEDGMDDYDVYQIVADTGERIQYKLKSYKVDIKTGAVTEFEADYIIADDLHENEASAYAAIKYYPIDDKRIAIETPHGALVDKDGKLVNSLDTLMDINLSSVTKLSGGAYLYNNYIFDSSFTYIAQPNVLVDGKLYYVNNNGLRYFIDGSGKVVESGITDSDYGFTVINGEYYEVIDGSLKKYTLSEKIHNNSDGMIIVKTDLTEDMTAADYAAYTGLDYQYDIHFVNSEVSWTVYSNYSSLNLYKYGDVVTYNKTVYSTQTASADSLVDYSILSK